MPTVDYHGLAADIEVCFADDAICLVVGPRDGGAFFLRIDHGVAVGVEIALPQDATVFIRQAGNGGISGLGAHREIACGVVIGLGDVVALRVVFPRDLRVAAVLQQERPVSAEIGLR